MQPGDLLGTKCLGHVLAEVTGSVSSLSQRSGSRWEITKQLDVYEPTPSPRGLNRSSLDVPTDREVAVKSVPSLVVLRHPHVGERCAGRRAPQRSPERCDVRPEHVRVVTTLASVGQRAEPVQTVRSAVPTKLAARPPRRFKGDAT